MAYSLEDYFKKSSINSLILFGRKSKESFVLAYHDIGSDEASLNEYCRITKKYFEHQIRYWLGEGYTFVANVEELKKPKRIMLTFDDGLESFEKNAIPILKKYKIPAIVFVPTKYIGKKFKDEISSEEYHRKRVMSESTLKKIIKSRLVELGSHTDSHFDANRKDTEFMLTDIKKSMKKLRKITGKNCEYFCYPVGIVNKKIKEILKHVGIKHAFILGYRTFNQCNNCLEIPRFEGDFFKNEELLRLTTNSNLNTYFKIRSIVKA